MKTPKNGIFTVTWKVKEDSKHLLGTVQYKIDEWLRSIMCMSGLGRAGTGPKLGFSKNLKVQRVDRSKNLFSCEFLNRQAKFGPVLTLSMLMSISKVNLVEASNYKDADIPISFLKLREYSTINNEFYSVAFSDVKQMENGKPTAPVYINMEPNCVRWWPMHGVKLRKKAITNPPDLKLPGLLNEGVT